MRISQKLEYACRALAQLAKHHHAGNLTRLEEIAQREDVSANFLVQILNDLRRGGLIDSRRGASGGYLLARPAAEISLRQIVEAVDPALLQNLVSAEGESGPAVRAAWHEISTKVTTALDSITLESIAGSQGGPMFYI